MLEKTSGIDNNQLSKEDYLIMRAKDALPIDIYAAKSWLITARSLFPHSAKVQVNILNVYWHLYKKYSIHFNLCSVSCVIAYYVSCIQMTFYKLCHRIKLLTSF